MWRMTIRPRFGDTDALGHINNTALPVWFETARTDIYGLFNPELDLKKWNLVMARMEIDFIKEIRFGGDVEIRSVVLRVGNSSFILGQEAWQGGEMRARGKCVLVYYDFAGRRAVPIPDAVRRALGEHMSGGARI